MSLKEAQKLSPKQKRNEAAKAEQYIQWARMKAKANGQKGS